MQQRRFRFGVQLRGAGSGEEWQDKARRVESLGYNTLQVADHFPSGLGAFVALASAAAVTERLRVGTFVLANDFRHPANLAKEAATLDLFSNGRLEVGIGAGWLRSEYEATGIPFDSAGTRINRLEEAIRLIKRLWSEESVDHHGDFYHVTGLTLVPRPAQTPHPPVMVGGGGKRVLSLAARLAEIVAINPRATPAGVQDRTDMTAEATERKVSWIREAAGERWGNIELNIVLLRVVPTDNRDALAKDLSTEFNLTTAEITDSPHILIGTIDQMAETLRERRERFGISYISVTEDGVETFAPVIERLMAM